MGWAQVWDILAVTLDKVHYLKAEQVWTFTRKLDVPCLNNASEQALKSARNHGVRAIDAIHIVLTGNPWLPTPAAA